MPFLDENGGPLRVIQLTQAPADGHYFQLRRPIGFREEAGQEVLWAPAHTPTDDPVAGNRTDLASVPWPLWGFIASYGRQSAPAILHDHQRTETTRMRQANLMSRADALAQAAEDDRIFRVGLRQQKVPLLRAWLMWAFVSVERASLASPACTSADRRAAVGSPLFASDLAELRRGCTAAFPAPAIVCACPVLAGRADRARGDRPAVPRP